MNVYRWGMRKEVEKLRKAAFFKIKDKERGSCLDKLGGMKFLTLKLNQYRKTVVCI